MDQPHWLVFSYLLSGSDISDRHHCKHLGGISVSAEKNKKLNSVSTFAKQRWKRLRQPGSLRAVKMARRTRKAVTLPTRIRYMWTNSTFPPSRDRGLARASPLSRLFTSCSLFELMTFRMLLTGLPMRYRLGRRQQGEEYG